MDVDAKPRKKGDKGVVMEGMLANWYARNTANDLANFEADARRIAGRLPAGARVLEIAPGPGYLSIALARLGPFRITGLDISRSFVRMASAAARAARLEIDFRHGDAAQIPFGEAEFDFIVCRAAFKNFADPMGALREMHRVLKPESEALIIDMSKDASNETIDGCVDDMKLGRVDSAVTKLIFKTTLRSRAYSKADFQQMAAATPFGRAEITEESIGLEVWLKK